MTKKKYSINWENDEAVSFEVDGAIYESLDDVPNENDRDKLAAMMQASEDSDFQDFKFDEKEFEELRKINSSHTVEKTVMGIFTGIAALMLLIAGVSSFFNVQKMSKEESADGVVTDITVRREYTDPQDRIGRDFYYPVVTFTASDGRKRAAQMSEGSDAQYYEKGNNVTVLYDPEHPLDARIKSASSMALMWILPGITGILGIAFGGAVLVVKKFLFTEESEPFPSA
ncbi:MAG: DUF3592 domain-containing protein [Anaerolineales bacterium]|nr:DUF3592 domain-containing protein [Anaerolineales bacterium]